METIAQIELDDSLIMIYPKYDWRMAKNDEAISVIICVNNDMVKSVS